jgi:Dolichyl-phosphate-mannose-protein mannosyltransferase
MNDQARHPPDLSVHGATVGAAGQGSAEQRESAATAALWRRRVRSHQGLVSAEDDDGRWPEFAPARPGPVALTAAGRPAPDIMLTTPVLDPPAIPPRPVRDPAAALPAAAAPTSREWAAARPGDKFALVLPPLLMAILTIQAVLSLRLVWSNTASGDEAAFLGVGHAEIEHWLDGTKVPVADTHLLGAPVMYPPIGAIADMLGGLAAARILSLLFMLGTTCLLWFMTSRLFGGRAAVCAALLFAVLGPTLQLGAFATADAMALFLLAASACCMVASRDRDDSALLVVGGTVLLVLANTTTYSTLLFDPSVVAIAGLTVAGDRGLKPAAARSGYVAAGAMGLICALLVLGGPSYLADVLSTTVSPTTGSAPILVIIEDSWKWAGPVCVIAGMGIVICALRRRELMPTMIVAILAISGIFAPLTQVRIHVAISLSPEVDFGAWFAAAAAGYALADATQIGRWRSLRLALTAVLLTAVALPGGIMGRSQASAIFDAWPDSAPMISHLRALTRAHPGNYLAEDYNVPAYYLESTIPLQRWSGTSYFSFTPAGAARPLAGLAAYRAAISRHYFSLIILDFVDTVQTDGEILTDMHQAGGYRQVAIAPSSVGQYTIWAYEPLQPSARSHGHR